MDQLLGIGGAAGFNLKMLILPLSLIAGGYLIGYIFEKIVLKKLKHIASRTSWQYDDVIIHSLHPYTSIWFLLIGIYSASYNMEFLSPTLHDYLRKLIIISAILSVTFFASKVLVGMVRQYSQSSGGELPTTSIFTNVTRISVIIIGFLIALQSLGISIAPILTALGVGGLAVALALQDTLSNLFSGIHILVSKQIRPGDFIRLDSGEEGFVHDIGWRNTMIRALPNNILVIPNSKMANSKITNFYLPEKEMSLVIKINVAYGSDMDRVELITLQAAKETLQNVAGGVEAFEPFIRINELGDFSIQFSVILRIKEVVDQHIIRHEFLKNLLLAYKREKIEIPFPVQTVHIAK